MSGRKIQFLLLRVIQGKSRCKEEWDIGKMCKQNRTHLNLNTYDSGLGLRFHSPKREIQIGNRKNIRIKLSEIEMNLLRKINEFFATRISLKANKIENQLEIKWTEGMGKFAKKEGIFCFVFARSVEVLHFYLAGYGWKLTISGFPCSM